MNIIPAIASVLNRKKKRPNRQPSATPHPIHTCTNEQHLKWLEEGKCQCCGAESGEFAGICDECRFS